MLKQLLRCQVKQNSIESVFELSYLSAFNDRKPIGSTTFRTAKRGFFHFKQCLMNVHQCTVGNLIKRDVRSRWHGIYKIQFLRQVPQVLWKIGQEWSFLIKIGWTMYYRKFVLAASDHTNCHSGFHVFKPVLKIVYLRR